MKRLIWLLLAVFGTALAQVQPVDLPVTKHEVCDCCAKTGPCGMPGCVPPASAPAPSAFSPASTVTIARLAPKPAAAIARLSRQEFFASFVSHVRVVPALAVTSTVAPAASVPRFREHCSLLL